GVAGWLPQSGTADKDNLHVLSQRSNITASPEIAPEEKEGGRGLEIREVSEGKRSDYG
ncbi:hypothetical protein BaRGS_00008221, partial [Batillaria attramentaria]